MRKAVSGEDEENFAMLLANKTNADILKEKISAYRKRL